MYIPPTSGDSSFYPVNPPPVIPTIESLSNELRAAACKKENIFTSSIPIASFACTGLLGGAFALVLAVPALGLPFILAGTIFLIIGLVQFLRYVACCNDYKKLQQQIKSQVIDQQEKERFILQLSLTLSCLAASAKALSRFYTKPEEATDIATRLQNDPRWKTLSQMYSEGIKKLTASGTNEEQKQKLHGLLTNIYTAKIEINAQLERLFPNQEDAFIQELQFSLEEVPPLPINAPPPQ